MRRTNVLTALFAAALVLGIAGCFTQRDKPGEERATLKAGQQVSAEMVGWVAVPNTVPQMKDAAGLKYAVLSTHNVVPPALDGWVAMNNTLFSKMADIKVDEPAAAGGERWVLKPEGKSIPKEKNGWVAVPFSEPQIEKSTHKKDREMAVLAANNIVPKEMHGWVAVSREDLAKITEKFMLTGPGSKASKDAK